MWVSWCNIQREMDSNQGVQESCDDPASVWHGPRGQNHPCPVCLEYFVTKLSLTTHIKGHQRATCYRCCLVYTDEEDLDDHVTQCHKPPPKAPQNSPVMTTMGECGEEEEEAEVSEDSGFQTPDVQMDLSFANTDSSTPKAVSKRSYNRRTTLHSDLVKRITTRSGRKINFKTKDD